MFDSLFYRTSRDRHGYRYNQIAHLSYPGIDYGGNTKMTGSKYYSHSGDIGDLIYGLALAKAVGPIDLVLFPAPGKTTVVMTESRAKKLFDLLNYQPYINSVRFEQIAYDTSWNGFRDHWHLHGGQNLSDCHISTHGLDWRLRKEKWLNVPCKIHQTPVTMNWTHRYHNWDFPWREVVELYGKDITFLGFDSEYKDFCNKYCLGIVPPTYNKETNFMRIAQIIAGSSLYIGNLTSTTAIAEGLKHKMIVEGCHNNHAHDFLRLGCLIAYKNRIEFPSLKDLL
jgi:hypothetical protein